MMGPALAVAAYLLGSLPVLYLIGRLRGYDLRGKDQHITLWRQVGRTEGLIGITWDIGKGALVVAIARRLELDVPWVALAGLAVVLGQMWPFLLWRLGEKGNSTGLGMALALSPAATGIALVPALMGAAWRTLPRMRRASTWSERLRLGGPPSRSLPLGVACGFGLLPIASAWLGADPVVSWAFLGLLLAVMVRRLTAGLELDELRQDTSVLVNRLLYDRSHGGSSSEEGAGG